MLIIFILICCCFCCICISGSGAFYYFSNKENSSSNNKENTVQSITTTNPPITTNSPTTTNPPTTTKPPTTKPPSLTGKWTTPNNSLAAINITMDPGEKKGKLRFDNSQNDYSFTLTDANQNLWTSDGFAMQLKLIDNNKLRPVTNPWKYTDEQLTYVKNN